jgi:N,N'-diacetyllegionaminate synthase
VNIGARQIDATQPPYIIAELGVNHDGSVDRAVELVAAARRAGADAVKLQLFTADRLLSRVAKLAMYQREFGAHDPFDMLRRLELSIVQMAAIVDAARQQRLHAMLTVFSVELVKEAHRLNWDAYKTASPDLINRPLIESLMLTGRPLLVSTGAATLDEVRETIQWLGPHPHILMQCVSAYPAPDDYAALAGREALCTVSPHALGYSDHTTSIDTGALAVASGARVLEKHLTHDRSALGPDHAASLAPNEFGEYVRLAHRAFRMLGEPVKRVLAVEQDVREVSRQSITVTRDLPTGHTLSRADLTVKRPGMGLSPSMLQTVIGRRVKRAIEADTPLVEQDLA